MRDCINSILEQIEQNKDSILVTIIDNKGSTPRGKGSVMAVGECGRLSGTIGGGAIEGRAIKEAMEQIGTVKNWQEGFSLDLKKSSDLGMVCGGDVTAYFSYVSADSLKWKQVLSEVAKCFDNKKFVYFAIDLKTGEAQIIERDYDKNFIAYPGKITENKFIMPLPLKERAVIFGGGHVAKALVPVLSRIGFSCIVFECRSEFADKKLFPDADSVILGDFEKIEDYITLSKNDYIVIMSSGHMHDYVIQKQVLLNDYIYVGVMGSVRKKESVNARLLEDGISKERVEKVHTPIGLEIHAVTPEEIAISVAAEMIEIRAQKRMSDGEFSRGCASGF